MNPFKVGDLVVFKPKKTYYSHKLTVGIRYKVIKVTTYLVSIQDIQGINVGTWPYVVFDKLETTQLKDMFPPEDQKFDKKDFSMNPFKAGDLVVYNPKPPFYATDDLIIGSICTVIKATTELVSVQDTQGIKLGMWSYKVFDKVVTVQFEDKSIYAMPDMSLLYPMSDKSLPEDQKTDGPKTSDGGSSTYYNLPPNARDVDDLIEHKDMNYRIANIFKACYRYGEKAGTSQLYDLKKIMFFAQREVERLERT